MKVKNYLEVEPTEYTDQAKGVSIRVLIGEKEGAPNFIMRLFDLEPQGYTPRHAHFWEHEVFVLGGRGTVISKGEEHKLKQGDAVFIPAEEEHQFRSDPESGFRFLCVIPRTEVKKG